MKLKTKAKFKIKFYPHFSSSMMEELYLEHCEKTVMSLKTEDSVRSGIGSPKEKSYDTEYRTRCVALQKKEGDLF